eukprot:Gb_39533 [translate_table: standard]
MLVPKSRRKLTLNLGTYTPMLASALPKLCIPTMTLCTPLHLIFSIRMIWDGSVTEEVEEGCSARGELTSAAERKEPQIDGRCFLMSGKGRTKEKFCFWSLKSRRRA